MGCIDTHEWSLQKIEGLKKEYAVSKTPDGDQVQNHVPRGTEHIRLFTQARMVLFASCAQQRRCGSRVRETSTIYTSEGKADMVHDPEVHDSRETTGLPVTFWITGTSISELAFIWIDSALFREIHR